jgi:hypothetical protein
MATTTKKKEVVTLSDVTLFKTFSLNETKTWGKFTVEFQGDKARVKNPSLFGSMVNGEWSRFNKLTSLGKGTYRYIYSLTVNRNQVFLFVPYDIFN